MPSSSPSIIGWVSKIIASTTITQQLDTTTIDSYTSRVAEFYGTQPEYIEVETTYETSGKVSISTPDGVSEEEVINTIANAIAESLGLHPSDVDVAMNMITGEAVFTVTSEDYGEAVATQFALETDQRIASIIRSIEAEIPDIIVNNFDVDDDVTVSLEFAVDANNASNDLTQAAWLSEQLLSDFEVTIDASYVTYTPTSIPSLTPTTSLPSIAPSLTGAISIIELSTTVTESLSATEITNIADEIAESYGVEVDDIIVDVTYETTGSIVINVIDDTLTDDEISEAIEDEIAALLGIHESDIDVTIEGRFATYTITSDNAESAQQFQDVIRDPSARNDLSNAIEQNVPVNVLVIEVEEDIGSEIVATVDTSGAEHNLENAARELEEIFEQQGFTAQANSNSIIFNEIINKIFR